MPRFTDTTASGRGEMGMASGAGAGGALPSRAAGMRPLSRFVGIGYRAGRPGSHKSVPNVGPVGAGGGRGGAGKPEKFNYPNGSPLSEAKDASKPQELREESTKLRSTLPRYQEETAEELALGVGLGLRMQSAVEAAKMHHYEVCLVLREDERAAGADGADEAAEVDEAAEGDAGDGPVVAWLEAMVKEQYGNLVRVEDWGVKVLAYKIAGAKRARYRMVNFECGAETVVELEARLLKDERVLRHLVMKQRGPPEKGPSSMLKEEDDDPYNFAEFDDDFDEELDFDLADEEDEDEDEDEEQED